MSTALAPAADLEVVTVDKPDEGVPCNAFRTRTCPNKAEWALICPTCVTTFPICTPHRELYRDAFDAFPQRVKCIACQALISFDDIHPI